MPFADNAILDELRRDSTPRIAAANVFIDQFFWTWGDAYQRRQPESCALDLAFLRAWAVAVAIQLFGRSNTLTRAQCVELDVHAAKTAVLGFLMPDRPEAEQRAFIVREHNPYGGRLENYFTLMAPVIEAAAGYVGVLVARRAAGGTDLEWRYVSRSYDGFVWACEDRGYVAPVDRAALLVCASMMLKDWVVALRQGIREVEISRSLVPS